MVDKKAEAEEERPSEVYQRLAGPHAPRTGSRQSAHSGTNHSPYKRKEGKQEGGSPKANSMTKAKS